MRSKKHVRITIVGLALIAAVAVVSSAWAVGRKVAYGKPGAVQIQRIEGFRDASKKPYISFPKHTMKRSSKAPRDSQRICTFFEVTKPATAPATGWVVAGKSKTYCVWVVPGNWALIGNWNFSNIQPGVQYHGRYTVTWATKKKKKLARATYDFNLVDDYKCTSLGCLVDQGTDKVPFISFTGT